MVEVTGFEVRACGADFVTLRDFMAGSNPVVSVCKHEKTAPIFMSTVAYGRGDRIRTCGLFVPNEALYQAEPHLDFLFFLAASA